MDKNYINKDICLHSMKNAIIANTLEKQRHPGMEGKRTRCSPQYFNLLKLMTVSYMGFKEREQGVCN